MSPQPTDKPPGQSMLPYLWQLAEGRDGLHFYPLEFESYDSHDAPAAKAELDVISQNTEFLHEFATRLWDFGLEDIFGIATLMSRSKIVLAPGETLLETTDSVNRVLTLAPIPEEELRGCDTTETLWTFSPPRPDAIELAQET